MELKFGNSVINSYKRLSYTPWYAFAEFVDNSTQAYFDHKKELDETLRKESKCLQVNIEYAPDLDKIVIKDNSFGMDYETLQKALTIGLPPENNTGRSKYGLGMKTAACWFGDLWIIKTKKLHETQEHSVSINVDDIAKNYDGKPVVLSYNSTDADKNEHYTHIEITKLNRKFRGRTLGKIKDYLRSMYRLDFGNYGLQLFWQGELLTWDNFDSKLYILENGKPFKQNFEFSLDNGKRVVGWVGVLGRGNASRKNAGFSIIKANRVIEGWPNGFKPNSIFGDIDSGVNDLINQRVVGELYLDDFEVSHTKDSIVWLDDEYEQLDEKIVEECKEAMNLANTVRYKKDILVNSIQNEAMEVFETELNSKEMSNFLNTYTPPSEGIIKNSYKKFEDSVTERSPDYFIEIGTENGTIFVKLFFLRNSSFEPYVLIESSSKTNCVLVLINTLHPHYEEITTSETLINFIRHCVYDGVAEWKAIKLLGSIQPYTIKHLKDSLLRVPFEMKKSRN